MGYRSAIAIVALAGAVAATGCGVPTDSHPQTIDRDTIPFGLVAPPATTIISAPARGQTAVEVFLIHNNRLARVTRAMPAPPTPDQVLAALVAGPTADENRQNLYTAISPHLQVLATSLRAGVLTVDLGGPWGQGASEQQVTAVAQIVFTATALTGVTGVSLKLDEENVEAPTGNGTLTTRPLTRNDFPLLYPV